MQWNSDIMFFVGSMHINDQRNGASLMFSEIARVEWNRSSKKNYNAVFIVNTHVLYCGI